MSTISNSILPTLRCTSTESPCRHYSYNSRTVACAKHRCVAFSPHGIRILGAKYNESSHTPAFCPYVTNRDKIILEGTILARKIGKKEKKLEEAQKLCEQLSAEIPQLYEQLREKLEGVEDVADDIINNRRDN